MLSRVKSLSVNWGMTQFRKNVYHQNKLVMVRTAKSLQGNFSALESNKGEQLFFTISVHHSSSTFWMSTSTLCGQLRQCQKAQDGIEKTTFLIALLALYELILGHARQTFSGEPSVRAIHNAVNLDIFEQFGSKIDKN